MTSAELLDITRQMLWLTFMVALPTLTVALVVGIAIGLLQALTSIQELTLTFVPKLGAVALTIWLTLSYMSNLLVGLYQDQIIPIIGGG
ncbi:MAG: flagellar biosynthetic protein FliQ [Pseudomonadota bacterium]